MYISGINYDRRSTLYSPVCWEPILVIHVYVCIQYIYFRYSQQ